MGTLAYEVSTFTVQRAPSQSRFICRTSIPFCACVIAKETRSIKRLRATLGACRYCPADGCIHLDTTFWGFICRSMYSIKHSREWWHFTGKPQVWWGGGRREGHQAAQLREWWHFTLWYQIPPCRAEIKLRAHWDSPPPL